jgi:uncharacterized protein (TIGR03437 family)
VRLSYTALLILALGGFACAQPSITANSVLNVSGYQSTLAPDTVFVIFGANLGPASIATAAAPSYPTSLGGTSITFTPSGGGAAINAKMIYSLAGQVAGLLPSSITPGTYAVRVIYQNQTSAPQNVTVVARSFGIAAANGYGTGTAQATIGNVNGGISLTRFNSGSVSFNGNNWTLTPAHPGDALVLWGTGGGADAANDTGGTSGDQTAAGNFIVNVGGRQVTPVYAGASSGYPGLWQVNFTLPSDITPDCLATAQVSAGGVTGNSVTIPIAALGQASCSDSSMPASVYSKLDSGGNITLAAFALGKLDNGAGTIQETASGSVQSYSTSEWITLESGPKFGLCRVYDRSYPPNARDPGSPDAFLDAGSKLSLTGPNVPAGFGLGPVPTAMGNAYNGSLTLGTLTSGSYTLTATGGTQVGPFNTSTTFPASFTLTNAASVSTIDRTVPLVLNWTSSGVDQVMVVLGTTVAGPGLRHLVTINCTLPAGPGTYTIDSQALAYLPLAPANGTAINTLAVEGTKQGMFTANLTAGGQTDIGIFSANLGISENVVVK